MAKIKSKNLTEKLIKKSAVKKKVLNPFEIHVNRQKFNVLGRKTKNDRGLPGVSRSKSLKKRKETLLQEYRVANKANRFLDHRIGENNSAMTEEDRILARFTAERIKQHNKKTMFNLNDDEVLTHQGKTLSQIEKYDDVASEDEDEFTSKESGLDAKFVEDAHFGGAIFREKGEGAKTHASLIDELISESKKKKAERQYAKEKTLELTEKLDADWHELQLLFGKEKPEYELDQRPEKGSYDQLMRELRFEARGVPSDRLKSEDELAREEKERLEKLEEERMKRMKGLDNSSKPQLKHRSADDLDDGFDIESEIPDYDDDNNDRRNEYNPSSADGHSDVDDEDDDDDDGEEEEEVEEENDDHRTLHEGESTRYKVNEESTEKTEDDHDSKYESESSDSEDDLSDLKQSSDDESVKSNEEEGKSNSDNVKEKSDGTIYSKKDIVDSTKNIKVHLQHKKEVMEKARKEIPYTFKLPETYEELQEIIEPYNTDQQSVVIERMIKCHHPKLGEKNKQGLEELFTYLLQLLNDAEDDIKWKLLDRLAPHLFDLTQFSPENSARSVIEVLSEKHDDFKKHPLKFPDTDTLVFLKIVPLLFPTSDIRHQVATPASVFLTQILNQCRVHGRRAIATGLFVVTLLLEYVALSKRFSPEAVRFLQGILELSVHDAPIVSLSLHSLSNHPLVLSEGCNATDLEDGKLTYLDISVDNSIDNTFRVRSISTAVRLLNILCKQVEDLSAFKIMFKPFETLLSKMQNYQYPERLKDDIKCLLETIRELNGRKMEYLVLEKKKPKALRLYEPHIEIVTDRKKRKNVSEEQAEHLKLVAKYKKEMKGALREIRKDNAFLAKVKFRDQARSDEERRRKVKQIYSWGAEQEGEYKRMKRKNK